MLNNKFMCEFEEIEIIYTENGKRQITKASVVEIRESSTYTVENGSEIFNGKIQELIVRIYS